MINLNKGISTPIALTVIIVLGGLVIGGILIYDKYFELEKEITQIEKPVKNYKVEVLDNGKKLIIKLEDEIVKEIIMKDIQPFDAYYNGLLSNPETDYVFDFTTSEKFVFDKNSNQIYFVVINKATAGNVNATSAIFAYNLDKDEISFLLKEEMSTGPNELFISSDGHYLVYDTGKYGGACINYSDLVVFDLKNKKEIDRLHLERIDQLHPDGLRGDTSVKFKEWINNNSFTYEEITFDQSKTCTEIDIKKDKIIVQKEYTIFEINDFFSENWQLIDLIYGKTQGDLNKDGLNDLSFVLEDKSSLQESYGIAEVFPRRLVILFQKEDGSYEISVQSDKVILLANEGGMYGDPFAGISIDSGSLLIDFYGGSSWRWRSVCRFRYQDNGWFLIGLTETTFWTGDNKGEIKDYNFLTNRMKKQTGIVGSLSSEKLEEEWFDIKEKPLLNLEQFDNDSLNSYLSDIENK